MKTNKSKKLIPLLLAVLAAAAIIYVTAHVISLISFSYKDEQRPADVAIVLGAATTDGEVSPVYRERINHGIQLYKAKTVKKLILTGGIGDQNTASDAYAAKLYAISQGVPADDILIEEKSSVTAENLRYAKLIMDEEGYESALIVSDPLHMKRAMLLADDIGICAYSSPTQTTMYKTAKTRIPFLMREIFFYIGYRWYRIFT